MYHIQTQKWLKATLISYGNTKLVLIFGVGPFYKGKTTTVKQQLNSDKLKCTYPVVVVVY